MTAENYKLLKDFQDDSRIRRGFNELTSQTYGFDFEDWYQNGYWTKSYRPYILMDGEKVIANVSVNQMEFLLDGSKRNYIQLGTVMTNPAYRNHGLCRFLMERILDEYKDKTDGIYLFANDTVLEFYPKFGFEERKQFQYRKKIDGDIKKDVIRNKKRLGDAWIASPINLSDSGLKEKLFEVIESGQNYYRLFQKNRMGLIAFYLSMGMEENLYYIEELDTFIIMERVGKDLVLYEVISSKRLNLDEIEIALLDSETENIILCFTPVNSNGYEKEILKGDDTLFVLGDGLQELERDLLLFPALSHA